MNDEAIKNLTKRSTYSLPAIKKDPSKDSKIFDYSGRKIINSFLYYNPIFSIQYYSLMYACMYVKLNDRSMPYKQIKYRWL